MTIIATAVGGAILEAAATIGTTTGLAAAGTTGASLASSLGGALGISSGLATGAVGAAGIGTAAGTMKGVGDAQTKQAQRADQKQGVANAAAVGGPPAAATNLYAANATSTPIASSDQKIFATGGIAALAKGGHGVRLEDSDYIIPADVVSALGNGSSKAGARYLQEQLARLNSVGGVGALPPAKHLRATRDAKKKHNA